MADKEEKVIELKELIEKWNLGISSILTPPSVTPSTIYLEFGNFEGNDRLHKFINELQDVVGKECPLSIIFDVDKVLFNLTRISNHFGFSIKFSFLDPKAYE